MGIWWVSGRVGRATGVYMRGKLGVVRSCVKGRVQSVGAVGCG